MKSSLITSFLFFVTASFGQSDYYQKAEQEAFDLANAGQYAKSLEKAYEIYGAFPDNINGHMLVSFDLINLGRYKEAHGYINSAFAIDPTNFSGYFNVAYYLMIEGDVNKAKEYLSESIKLYPKDFPLKEVLDEIRKVGVNVNKAAAFSALADWYEVQHRTITQRDPTILKMTAEFSAAPENIRTITDKYVAQYTALKWPEMAVGSYAVASFWLRSYGYLSESLSAAQAGYNYLRKNGYGNNAYQASYLINQLMQSYRALGNDEQLVKFVNEVLELSGKLPIHVHDVDALIMAASAYDHMGNNDESRRLAGIAYKTAEQAAYRYGAVSAANSLCAAYNLMRFDTDVSNAVYYGENALQLGLKYKFESLLRPIMENLALAYYKTGTREGQEKCIRTYGSLVELYKQKQMWSEASVSLNNMGALMMHGGGYQYAAEYFEESIALAKRGQGELNAEDKLTYYQSQISAYQFLTVCYAYLDNAEKAYEAIEGSRSRVLTERLAKGKDVRAGTISELQKMLKDDEAAIFYSLFSAHEVVILVITKKYSKVMFHKDDTFIGNIKEKYLDRLNKEHGERKGRDLSGPVSRESRVVMADFQKVTQLTRKFFEMPGVADETLKEYLQGYYRFLIVPVLNRLGGIKNLLISPDDVLNYIPFEALQLHNGTYLVEKYNVRYLNSAGALRLIEQRKYSSSRKPLLAMGGAIYEPNLAIAPAVKTQQDLNNLAAEVLENKTAGTSQRKAYAALFGNGAMNALPGTLKEVNTIAKYVPGSDVFTGSDFTENRLKSMSASGALQQYKVLHLATHGFVVGEMPDLSGVAMSIFSKEQGGEDGFLNVNEIATLNLNADLAILSACQTALGKIYSGEGVTGLTQSLLIAGSNAALVSLWPVNDESTSLFMSDLYKEAAKGKSYSQVVAEIKRKFIKGEYGEQFKHPNYWAPFVYFGK